MFSQATSASGGWFVNGFDLSYNQTRYKVTSSYLADIYLKIGYTGLSKSTAVGRAV